MATSVRLSLLCVMTLATVSGFAFEARAQMFRVENRVTDGNGKQLLQTVTLFHEAIIYDTIDAEGEITVYDTARGRIVLLDPKSQIKTTVSRDLIRAYVESLTSRANQEQSSYIRFLVNPRFEETYDEAKRTLTLSSPFVTYVIQAAEAEAAVVKAYRGFADATAELSSILYPVSMPPHARLQVNAALARRNLIPKEVHVTTRPGGTRLLSRATERRSKHEIRMGIVDADRRQIAKIGEQLATFRDVTFEQYRATVHPRDGK